MGNPNFFRHLKREVPAWLFALSVADRRCGPTRCQGQLDAQPVVRSLLDAFATACRILHLRMKESVCNMTYII